MIVRTGALFETILFKQFERLINPLTDSTTINGSVSFGERKSGRTISNLRA
jgi:hypothetical protein